MVQWGWKRKEQIGHVPSHRGTHINLEIAAQWVGDRDISDHCPIWLACSVINWGPKPFRFNNVGLIEHKEFKPFVEECWRSFNVGGWKVYAFEEKLKMLKEKLKGWNKEVFGHVDMNIQKIVKELNDLDDSVCSGSSQEVERKNKLSSQFWQQIHAKESLIRRKARYRWIMEGDANTKYFHACVKGRMRRNQLLALKKRRFMG